MDAIPDAPGLEHTRALLNPPRRAGEAVAAPRRTRFYVTMSAICVAVAVIGFLPTFFIPLAQGQFARAPIFYLHGGLFFAWTAYFFAQSYLAMKGRLVAHRGWGILGAVLATAMVFSVVCVVIVRLNQTQPVVAGPGFASFSWIQVSGIAFFAVCIALALATTRRPYLHKRLMLLASLCLLGAPIARWNVVFSSTPAGGGPPSTPIGAVVCLTLTPMVLLLLPWVHDLRTERKISLVYLIGVPLFLMLQFAPIGGSTAWLAIARWLKHVPG